ncbi:O-antigen ligase family protein [Faunimonas sp. B44]|uniref:O-antigen ligase family protein n=1 Tax=Faunimonas sp. B44 TaxID=3461493 RepID=UPI0040446308
MEVEWEKVRRSTFALGILFGIACFIPLLGRVYVLPGRVLALLAVLAAIALAVTMRTMLRRPSRTDFAFLVLASVLGVLVVLAGQPSQWAFLFRFRDWLGHENAYYEAKLLLFMLAYAPTLPMLAIGAMIPRPLRPRLAVGLLVGLLIVAVLAQFRLWSHWPRILTDDADKALLFFLDLRRGFSTVAYSGLFASAAAACMYFVLRGRRQAVLCGIAAGVFLLGTVLTNQRADVALGILALIGIAVMSPLYARVREHFVRVQLGLLAAGLTAAVLIALVVNPVHKMYWNDLLTGTQSEGVSVRMEAITAALQSTPDGRTGGSPLSLRTWTQGLGLGSGDRRPAEAGRPTGGLGYYAILDPVLKHPHNVVLELWVEVGRLAVVAFAAMCAFTAIATLRPRPPRLAHLTFCLSAIAAVMLLHALKAGDTSTLGAIVFLLWIAGSLPRKEVALASDGIDRAAGGSLPEGDEARPRIPAAA